MGEFFSWQGRLNRRPYFFRGLALSMPVYLLYKLPKAWGVSLSAPVSLLFSLIILAALVLGIFQIIKRLHDLDKSGWYSLLMIIPFLNFLVGLYLTFAKGTEGPNTHGEDPLLKCANPS